MFSNYARRAITRCRALQDGLSIFQYWFARCAVELWVRFRQPGGARRCIVADLVSVDLFQRGYRGNYGDHGKCNGK